nr:MAG TPA: hypothetical protein [Caudoviricetes sp.]
MLIEYMNYSLSKTPTTIMTEDVFGDTGLSFSLSAKYSAVVSFLKSQFNALLKDSYSIEVERIVDSSSEDDNDTYEFQFKSIYLKNKPLFGEIKMNGTFVTKFEIDNSYDYSEMYGNMLNSHNEEGTVAISDKDQTVDGTSLVIENKANEFMQTMNSKFIRKKGEN